jgi:hypothetical protein
MMVDRRDFLKLGEITFIFSGYLKRGGGMFRWLVFHQTPKS